MKTFPDYGQRSLIEIETPAKILKKIISLPKIDLHRHLTGSIDPSLAIEIALKYDIYLPTYIHSELHAILTKKPIPLSHEDYFSRWEILNRLFISAESTYDIVTNVIKKASEDNIVYMELRMGPRGFLGKTQLSLDCFLEAVSKAVYDGEANYRTITRCILGLSRHETFGNIKSNVRERMFYRIITSILDYYPNCFVGVDLNGIESDSEDDLLKGFFQIAKKKGLRVTAHAGELGSVNNIIKSIEDLGANRIGHGLAAANKPEVMELILKHDIALEICPKSNEFLGIISSYKELPIKTFKDNKVPFVISTDNPAICQTSISEELFRLYYANDISLSDINILIKNSIKYAFASEEIKEKLRSVVLQKGEI